MSGARLQAVRQLEEALLIVDDVQEVDVGSHLRAALLADAISCTTKESVYLHAHFVQAAVKRRLVRDSFFRCQGN